MLSHTQMLNVSNSKILLVECALYNAARNQHVKQTGFNFESNATYSDIAIWQKLCHTLLTGTWQLHHNSAPSGNWNSSTCQRVTIKSPAETKLCVLCSRLWQTRLWPFITCSAENRRCQYQTNQYTSEVTEVAMVKNYT